MFLHGVDGDLPAYDDELLETGKGTGAVEPADLAGLVDVADFFLLHEVLVGLEGDSAGAEVPNLPQLLHQLTILLLITRIQMMVMMLLLILRIKIIMMIIPTILEILLLLH